MELISYILENRSLKSKLKQTNKKLTPRKGFTFFALKKPNKTFLYP